MNRSQKSEGYQQLNDDDRSNTHGFQREAIPGIESKEIKTLPHDKSKGIIRQQMEPWSDAIIARFNIRRECPSVFVYDAIHSVVHYSDLYSTEVVLEAPQVLKMIPFEGSPTPFKHPMCCVYFTYKENEKDGGMEVFVLRGVLNFGIPKDTNWGAKWEEYIETEVWPSVKEELHNIDIDDTQVKSPYGMNTFFVNRHRSRPATYRAKKISSSSSRLRVTCFGGSENGVGESRTILSNIFPKGYINITPLTVTAKILLQFKKSQPGRPDKPLFTPVRDLPSLLENYISHALVDKSTPLTHRRKIYAECKDAWAHMIDLASTAKKLGQKGWKTEFSLPKVLALAKTGLAKDSKENHIRFIQSVPKLIMRSKLENAINELIVKLDAWNKGPYEESNILTATAKSNADKFIENDLVNPVLASVKRVLWCHCYTSPENPSKRTTKIPTQYVTQKLARPASSPERSEHIGLLASDMSD